jgi:rSAM/selenodomain-associated transferase 2
MTAPVSVVIPTLDEAARIGPCLAALTEGLMRGLITELVLADGGSTDGIGAVADAAGARLVAAPPGRGPQLAAGARAARGAWLLFLHADTVLSPGWAEAAARHIAERPDRAGYFRLAFDSRHPMARVTAGWANLRARAFGMPFGDQGLLVPRALYERVGGYPEIPLMEDMGVARRLGGALAPLDATAVTSAERYLREGWLARGARNLSTQALWLAGVPPERLAARYRR